MIYFDTDFWIHYFIIQDRKKHLLTKRIFEKVKLKNQVFISLLNLQELAFVLAKLEITPPEIYETLEILYQFNPLNYNFQEYQRAITICQKVGFNSINDCLHTAIAENNCDELYTFNQIDFKKIKNYTSLKINILSV
ncbi:MAG: type II toxin-antitoxin system VapC family toxin [Spirosomataceae bacterium]